jgi:hypothetical protein
MLNCLIKPTNTFDKSRHSHKKLDYTARHFPIWRLTIRLTYRLQTQKILLPLTTFALWTLANIFSAMELNFSTIWEKITRILSFWFLKTFSIHWESTFVKFARSYKVSRDVSQSTNCHGSLKTVVQEKTLNEGSWEIGEVKTRSLEVFVVVCDWDKEAYVANRDIPASPWLNSKQDHFPRPAAFHLIGGWDWTIACSCPNKWQWRVFSLILTNLSTILNNLNEWNEEMVILKEGVGFWSWNPSFGNSVSFTGFGALIAEVVDETGLRMEDWLYLKRSQQWVVFSVLCSYCLACLSSCENHVEF